MAVEGSQADRVAKAAKRRARSSRRHGLLSRIGAISHVESRTHEEEERDDKDLADALRPSSILNLSGRLADSIQQDLLYSVEDDEIMVLNLTGLQKLGIQAMRRSLAECAVKIVRDKSLSVAEAKRTSNLMHRYCTSVGLTLRTSSRVHADILQGEALKDLNYMKEMHSKYVEQDPFKMVSSVQRDHLTMAEVGLLEYIIKEHKCEPDAPDDLRDPTLIGTPRGSANELERLRDFLLRLGFGVLGGVALVGPMVLMILHNTLVTQVATTGVATFLFAVCMASYRGPDASPLAVVGTTAAYAAVLVVFVGTSS